MHTRGQNLGQKVYRPFGKNLMGFYQEIISMFIIYWVPVLYILGRFCILGAKIWGKKCTLLLAKIWWDFTKKSYQCSSYTGYLYSIYLGYLGLHWATLGYIGLPWATLGYLGLSWATLGFFGLAWAILGVLGLFWAVLGVLGLPWVTLRYFGATLGYFGLL
jgi:hypothetical protein